MSEALLPSGRTLGVIGAGVMGSALLKGMLDHGLLTKEQAWAASKTETSCQEIAASLGIVARRDYDELVAKAGILLILKIRSMQRWMLLLAAERLCK